MKYFYLLTLLIWSGCNLEVIEPDSNSSTGNVQFKAVYGGPSNDFAKDILVTSDNNYVAVGYSSSFGNGNQIFAIKVDKSGNKVWQKDYGGTGDENAFAILETSDKGYIFSGYSTSGSGFNKEVYVVKTDILGNKDWDSPLSHFSDDEIAFGVIELPNREYLIPYNNISKNSIGITRLNSTGKEIGGSNKTILNNCNCSAKKVFLTSDNNLVFTGYKQSKHWVYKADLSGIKIWEYILSGVNSIGYSTIEMDDKSFFSAGSVTTGSKEQFNVIHLNSSGVQLGTTITSGGLLDDMLLGITKSTGGDYTVSGITDSYGSDSQIYLSKRNKDSGAETWFKNFDETQWIWDDNYSMAIKTCPDGGYVICAGLSKDQSDFIIYKTDAEGNFK